jgi:hypothetical protein
MLPKRHLFSAALLGAGMLVAVSAVRADDNRRLSSGNTTKEIRGVTDHDRDGDHGDGQSGFKTGTRGSLQAIVDYCVRVDPRDADKLRALGKLAIGSVSGDGGGNGPTYDSVTDSLKAKSAADGAKTCALAVK